MKSLLCLLSLLPLVLGAHDLSSSYTFSSTLYDWGGDTYVLHWNFNNAERTIAFAVNVSTTGWVGFGISPNGGMVNSDVVIGWVRNEQAYFHDRYADRQALPPIDASQDWFLVSGEEAGGYTILEFTRNWTTCDDRDRDIVAQTARVVFSWNDADPTAPDGSDTRQHQTRGSASVNLLGGLPDPPPEPSDSEDFFIGVNSVEIPGDQDTTYWCVAVRIPENVRTQQHYIYKYGPRITPNNTAFVHHIIVYLCDGLVNVTEGQSSECFGQATAQGISECRLGTAIGGWAVGGVDFLFPPNVGYPIGGPGESQFAVIEMHYDNPRLMSGVYDSSGLVFSYTAIRPRFEAGVLTIGTTVNYNLLIPPRATNFTVLALCPATCTQRFIPPSGYTVFGNFFHTHLAGHGLTLQHYRQNPECGVLEELKPIDQNLAYDFDYQQTVYLPAEVTVLPISGDISCSWVHLASCSSPTLTNKITMTVDGFQPSGEGDVLSLKCFYNTAGTTPPRTGVTVGGEGTREEMCFAFLNYYPRMNSDLAVCGSVPDPRAYVPFVQNDIPQGPAQQTVGNVLSRWGASDLTTAEVENAFNQVEWTQEQVDSFSRAVVNGNAYTFCLAQNGTFEFDITTTVPAQPNAQCGYEAPNNCTDPPTVPLPCCQRPGVVGSGVMVVSSLLLMAVTSLTTLLL